MVAFAERLEHMPIGESLQIEARARRSDGTYRWLRISAAVADGPEPLVYLSGTDVTDLHEALEQLAGERTRSVRRTAELERSNAELERFAAVVSHDLRQSLTAVSGFLALLESRHGAALTPDAAELLALAREGGERMHALVEDLLAYARVGHSGRAPSASTRASSCAGSRRPPPGRHARARRTARGPRAPARVRAAAGEPDRQRGQVRRRGRNAGVSVSPPARAPAGASRSPTTGSGSRPRTRRRIFGMFARSPAAEQYPGPASASRSPRKSWRRPAAGSGCGPATAAVACSASRGPQSHEANSVPVDLDTWTKSRATRPPRVRRCL